MEEPSGVMSAEDVAARLLVEGLSIEHLRRRFIKLAVPCYRDVSPWHLLSMVHTTAVLNAAGVGYGLHTIVGMPVADARNALANRMAGSPYTDLLMIDADMSWEPWDAIRLIASGLPVIAAVGKKKHRHDADQRSGAAQDGGGASRMASRHARRPARGILRILRLRSEPRGQSSAW